MGSKFTFCLMLLLVFSALATAQKAKQRQSARLQAETLQVETTTVEPSPPTTEAPFEGSGSVSWVAGFHILFWINLVLFIVLYYIIIGMWTMDPGKDTIIYRLTATRYKKEV